ncbi:protein phosphatase 2, regulatory subunit A [Bonamia ostreae]|uniref:Protein phosphatase 2, regulatory subunit A n=1 Tax=Bonamia ostreae TaxID=126728 RepID=A0ABV2AMD1_9EUKA
MKKDKKGKLTECFLKLLEDEEEQVSISAIKQIVDLFSITGDDFFEFKENIYNRLKLAAENQQFSVMNNVISEQLGDLVKVETKFSQEILDLIKIYLNSDQEILVVNILSKSNLLLNKMGYQNFVAHFNEPLLKISDSSNWRFRLSALKTISLLSEKLVFGNKNLKITTKKTETEFEQFIKTLEKLLEDETQKIREESCLMSWKLLKKFGFEWSSKNVLPFIRDLSDVQRYLHRMTPLFFLFQIEEKVDDRMNDFVIKIFKKLLNDRISNVKDFALRVVDKISPFLNTEIAALVFEESKSARQ